MVRICAALAWFDEPQGFLDRCIRSLRGVVDDLVALDGRWEEHPGDDIWSSPANVAEVNAASLAAGIKTVPMRPSRPYVSQLEKRQDLMRFASANADWVLVIDADEYVVHAEPQRLRAMLATTHLEVGYVAFRNLNVGETMPGIPLNAGLNRRLFRSGTTLKTVHSGYVREGRNLLVSEDSIDLRGCLAIEHDNVNRGPERNEAARAYRRNRSEMWVKV